MHDTIVAVSGYVFPNEIHVTWTIMIVLYPYITGLVAGAFIVSSLYHLFGRESLRPVARFALVSSLVFLLFAPLPLLLHLGTPERALNIMITPSATSAMSGFGIIYLTYLIIVVIEVWFALREDLVRLAEELAAEPMSSEATQTIRAVMDLALSLNGLPPQTFEIFSKFEIAGPLAPLLLYRCEEQHLSTILELFDGLCSSWSLLPIKAWDAAFQAQGNYLVSRLDDPQWVLANITERQNEIAARAPQLAPLICRDFSPLSWEELRNHFTSHTSEGINMDAGGFNPFRPAYSELLPRENFVEALMRVFDAPFAAALSATGRASLEKEQVLTIKDVERRHPDYFAKAFGYAVSELKNGRQ